MLVCICTYKTLYACLNNARAASSRAYTHVNAVVSYPAIIMTVRFARTVSSGKGCPVEGFCVYHGALPLLVIQYDAQTHRRQSGGGALVPLYNCTKVPSACQVEASMFKTFYWIQVKAFYLDESGYTF